MSQIRGQFSSRIGFIIAASGSAVGLGNIWGFPTNVASNGGAAFVLVYLLLAFCLAYPVLMAELTIGRYARANIVDALSDIAPNQGSRWLGKGAGLYGTVVASLILSFYAIVAGWMIANLLAPMASQAGFGELASWLLQSSEVRNLVFCGIFSVLTLLIISAGVENGIEKWSTRLMPALLILMIGLIVYVLLQDGASEGLQTYLVPDFNHLSPNLVISALGQAFFSLSLGVGTMLIYGSYVSKRESLPVLGLSVTLIDIGIAVLAGLLIIPAMYVAMHNGVQIFAEDGSLINGPALVMTVLPALFDTMGQAGIVVSIAFFTLMTIAALTSSISMLEVPVAYAVEHHRVPRRTASVAIGLAILVISGLIIFNFDTLFGFIITLTTQYSQPLISLVLCIFVGWLWNRQKLLAELSEGHPELANSLFWKIWPNYVRFVCPVLILVTLAQSIPWVRELFSSFF